MKKITIILILILIFTGCDNVKTNNGSSSAGSENNVDTSTNLTEVTGVLETKYIENNIKYIILDVENISKKLDAGDVKDFEILEDGQILKLTYNEEKKVVDLLSVEDPEKNTDTNTSATSNNRVISYSETFSLEGLNEYKNADLQNFLEFGFEKVILYTDAENDGQGDFYWDDGNRFVLIAHKGEGGYILFDKRVQIGESKVNIYSIEDSLNISMLEYGTANISFRVYKFVDDEFIESIKYQGEGNVNMLGNL